MKIALIVPGGVDRSGEYRVIPVLLALLRRLAVRHELHVFCLAQESEPGEWELSGARIHNIGVTRNRRRAFAAVLHEHRRAPFRVLHSIWSGACSLVAVFAARMLHLPSIVHIAGGELAAIPDISYGGALSLRGRLRERAVLRSATIVTAATPFIIDAAARFGVVARLVPLGIDLNDWTPHAPRVREPGDAARLIHVASLNRVKDQTTLLHALAELASMGCEFTLDVVGEDTLGGEIQALSSRLGFGSRVRFHGFMTQRELHPLMEAAHVMVMASRHEAGPVAMLEAAALGVPTVGTAVGHIAEWSPAAARAVPIGHPGALAAAIAELLDDETLRVRIAAAAMQRAMRQNADVTAALIEQLYDEVTAQ